MWEREREREDRFEYIIKYENLVNGLKNIYISFLIYCLIFIKVNIGVRMILIILKYNVLRDKNKCVDLLFFDLFDMCWVDIIDWKEKRREIFCVIM